MIVRSDLKPVVDTTQEDVGGYDVGNSTVLENDVHYGKVVDIVVVRTNMPFVSETFHPCQSMRSCRNRFGTDWPAVPSLAFHTLEIKYRCQRVTALTYHHTTAGELPETIIFSMRA